MTGPPQRIGPVAGADSEIRNGDGNKGHSKPSDGPSSTVLHWIRPSNRGTFDLLESFEPGAIKARFLRVNDLDRELIDIIAWSPDQPSIWWTQRDLVTHVGTDALSRASWLGKPAYFVETPQRFLEVQKRAACVIDWNSDINTIIGECESVVCETAALAKRMRNAVLTQCRPGIADRITAHVRRAA